eukprot:scaffold8383_cov23-Cyclotella_meneghiniana.AAC.2
MAIAMLGQILVCCWDQSYHEIELITLNIVLRFVPATNNPRASAILEPLKVVTIHNWDNKLETLDMLRHPKREDLGDRAVPFGRSMSMYRKEQFLCRRSRGHSQQPQIACSRLLSVEPGKETGDSINDMSLDLLSVAADA